VKIQRGLAIAVDLALVTAIIRDLPFVVEAYPAMLDLYHVVVVTGALWFHREGGILTAAAASTCLAWLFSEAGRPWGDVYDEVAPRALVCMIIGVVTGYVARARSGERRQRERTEWELSVAGQVQAEMLPQRLPEPPGFELGAVFVPARVVGGDYYDAVIAPDGRLFVAVADVAGKSVQAVMQLSLLRSHLHEAVADGLAPREIATRLNHVLLAALTPGRFISLFCGAIDLESGRLCYVNCGHTPPLIVGADETEERRLFTGNIVLGVDAEASFEEGEAALGAGAHLVICTDGVTEAMGEEWRPFGTSGVAEAVRQVAGASPDEVARAILAASESHARRARPDDATILVVRRLPGGD
jgi:sigma-B regulation protein RsbU (phosphoserine phosphatase)